MHQKLNVMDRLGKDFIAEHAAGCADAMTEEE
jgi:hypothetical protein